MQLTLSPFTLVGATTRSGLLTAPLRARFGINCHLEYYGHDVLCGIIRRSARLLDVGITDEAGLEIALRSRGTPRIANALLRRVRDFAMVVGDGSITIEIAREALEALNIDQYGLDEIDNRILLTIIDKFKGGPVGLSTIATALGEDAGTIEEVYEPYPDQGRLHQAHAARAGGYGPLPTATFTVRIQAASQPFSTEKRRRSECNCGFCKKFSRHNHLYMLEKRRGFANRGVRLSVCKDMKKHQEFMVA